MGTISHGAHAANPDGRARAEHCGMRSWGWLLPIHLAPLRRLCYIHAPMGDQPPEPLTPHQIRAVATRAYCDPRTVAAYLSNAPQNGNTRARVEDALRAAGFEGHVRGRACA